MLNHLKKISFYFRIFWHIENISKDSTVSIYPTPNAPAISILLLAWYTSQNKWANIGTFLLTKVSSSRGQEVLVSQDPVSCHITLILTSPWLLWAVTPFTFPLLWMSPALLFRSGILWDPSAGMHLVFPSWLDRFGVWGWKIPEVRALLITPGQGYMLSGWLCPCCCWSDDPSSSEGNAVASPHSMSAELHSTFSRAMYLHVLSAVLPQEGFISSPLLSCFIQSLSISLWNWG